MRRAMNAQQHTGRGTDDFYWRATLARDLSADRTFVYAVRSTGIYCRPSCPAMTPRRENVVFYPTAAAAQQAQSEQSVTAANP